MNIVYVSQYFPPEMGAPSARVSELASEWAKDADDQITVLTGFAHHPKGAKAPRDRFRLTRREEYRGVDVVRSYVFATANRGTLRRMVSYASFMASAVLVGLLRIRRPDVIIATSPQLLCALGGYILSRIWRVPFVFEVRDLWPESIIAVDAMKDNLLIRALKGMARHLYEHADQIVTVGDGYRRMIHEFYDVDPGKMEVIPNGVRLDAFSPGTRNNDVRREFGWGNRFVVMYIGTHGMAHGLSTVLDAAERLRSTPEVLFVFVGEGAEKESLQNSAGERGLDNVQFIGQQSKERIPGFYAACDVGLVLLRDTPLFQSVLPSKIFEYLAMERPIILGVAGDARAVVEKAGAGVWIPPEDPAALVAAVEDLAAQRGRLAEMGGQGRRFITEHYDRRLQAARYRRLLRAVANQAASGPGTGRQDSDTETGRASATRGSTS